MHRYSKLGLAGTTTWVAAIVIVIGCGGSGTTAGGSSGGSTTGTTAGSSGGTSAGTNGSTNSGGQGGGALGAKLALHYGRLVSIAEVTSSGLRPLWSHDVDRSNESVLLRGDNLLFLDGGSDIVRQFTRQDGTELTSFGNLSGQFYEMVRLKDGRMVTIADEGLDVGFRVVTPGNELTATVIDNDVLDNLRFIQSDRAAAVLADGRLLLRLSQNSRRRLVTFSVGQDNRVTPGETFLEMGTDLEVSEAEALAVFSDGTIVMGDSRRDRLSLYRPDRSLVFHTGLIKDCSCLTVARNVFQAGDEILFVVTENRTLTAYRWSGGNLQQVDGWQSMYPSTIYDIDGGG